MELVDPTQYDLRFSIKQCHAPSKRLSQLDASEITDQHRLAVNGLDDRMPDAFYGPDPSQCANNQLFAATGHDAGADIRVVEPECLAHIRHGQSMRK